MARLVAKLGGDPRTASGLSGVGDLVLTCTGDLSRNRTVGLRLGRGETLEQILADMKMVAEGVKNSGTVGRASPTARASRCRSPSKSASSFTRGSPRCASSAT